jgi:hypothetical protein
VSSLGSKSAIAHGKFGRKKKTWKTIFTRESQQKERPRKIKTQNLKSESKVHNLDLKWETK